jgi:hypothetical protein
MIIEKSITAVQNIAGKHMKPLSMLKLVGLLMMKKQNN